MRVRHSGDVRRRAIELVRQGVSKSEAARHFGVGYTTVFGWLAEEGAGVSLLKQASLEDARKALGLTQAALASSLGLSVTRATHFELGTRTAPAYALMALSFLLATSESPGREIVGKLISEKLMSDVVDQ